VGWPGWDGLCDGQRLEIGNGHRVSGKDPTLHPNTSCSRQIWPNARILNDEVVMIISFLILRTWSEISWGSTCRRLGSMMTSQEGVMSS